jgi:hypothetical protein
MLELTISQVQKQLASILSETTLVVDKAHKEKKAVILPYELYEKLMKECKIQRYEIHDLDKYIGILSDDFETNDQRYARIVK